MLDKTQWCHLYNTGMSSTKIAKQFSVSVPTVLKYLRNNVELRTSQKSLIFNVPINEILSKFDSKISVSKLAKEYNYTVTGMSNLLKSNNRIILRPEDYCVNDWSFILDNRELYLYWLGWMLSDGCIYYKFKNGRNRGIMTYLGVHINDIKILELFRSIINPNLKISLIGDNFARINISIPRKYADIVELYGLIRHKSLILKPTDTLQKLTKSEFFQMLIGYIEGDGHINVKNIKSRNNHYKILNIGITCGSKEWLEWINEKFIKFGYKSRKLQSNWRINSKNQKYISTYDYRIAGSDAVRLYKELMKCKYHLLNRKWNKGLSFL